MEVSLYLFVYLIFFIIFFFGGGGYHQNVTVLQSIHLIHKWSPSNSLSGDVFKEIADAIALLWLFQI